MESTNNRICKLFNIQYPIIQAGMIWCSSYKLAAEVSNAGGLGIIGAGSMYPEVLIENIKKIKQLSSKSFAVNLPLLYPQMDEMIKIIVDNKVPIVFTSAGNPAKYTGFFKENNIKVAHVVSSKKFALKAQEAGVDAVVGEGFEAGGHNGREETTTLCLIPDLAQNLKIPVIAAGGIATGAAMFAMFALGAEGVQVGSRFVASVESSAHQSFKERVIQANEGETELTLKELTPVRLLKNKFYQDIQQAYINKANVHELKDLLGRGRAKKGMFEGNLTDGELEIGQVSALINEIKPASEIIREFVNDFNLNAQKSVFWKL